MKSNGLGTVHHVNAMSRHVMHLPAAEEKRLAELFSNLDKDGDGRINAADVMAVFDHVPEEYVQKSVAKADLNTTGSVDFTEFVGYVRNHEKDLARIFSTLDMNLDGKLDPNEVVSSFSKLGISMGLPEAVKLLKRIDGRNPVKITFDEFRDFFLWYPSASMQDLCVYWKHSSFTDLGECALVPDDLSFKEKEFGWWRHLAAGGVAGGVSRTATAPLDRIKTFFQVYGKKGNYESMLKCFFSMIKEGGYLSLWRGNGMNVIKIAPESAIKFMAYEQMKKLIKGSSERDLFMYERILAGSIAGAVSQTAIYPMEVVKTRLTLRTTGQFHGIWDVARHIYIQEGLRAFYRGYAPNLMGILPYAGIDLAVYETLKRMYIKRHPPSKGDKPPVMVVLGCGMVSSICGQVSSYPLALVKTKLQANVGPVVSSDNSTLAVMRQTVAQEGYLGLYRGMGPNFLKAVPAVSISYVVYEQVREMLGGQMT